jgi:replicative DNA helicase
MHGKYFSTLDMAEKELLMCLVAHPASIEQAQHGILETDFVHEGNRQAWVSILNLWQKDKSFSQGALVAELLQQGEDIFYNYLDIYGVELFGTNDNFWAWQLKALRDLRLHNDTILLAKEISVHGRAAKDAYQKFEELLAQGNKPERVKGTADHVKDFFDTLIAKVDGEITGISTGFKGLDEIIGGLTTGCLYVVAARPKQGKTSLGQQLAINVMNAKRRALIVDCEMSAWATFVRLAARESGIPAHAIQTGKGLTKYQVERVLDKTAALFGSGNLEVQELIGATWREVVSVINTIHAKKPLDLVVVDQLQAMRFTNRNTVKEMGEATKGLRNAAKLLGCAVVLLCQLNRTVEHREGNIPKLADLRDSGEIEQDADCVIFIHPRDDKKDVKGENKKRYFSVAASRFTGTGQVAVEFISHLTTFIEDEKEDEDYGSSRKDEDDPF